MKFSYDWIQELSHTSLSREEAAELLSAKVFETVVSNTPGVLDIDVLPNRPDALSHLGVARELAALSDSRFVPPVYEWHVSERPAREVTVEDSVACPRYSALVVRGLKVGPSPNWLVERLSQCGLQSINNVVDVTNYTMLELGQPMHAFDLSLVDRIVVRHARQGESVSALDQAHTTYALDESMLVIADGEHALAIAGIKGGVGTGISKDTTDVLLEAANFSPESIRATSGKLDLRTDASVRFSYGVDPNLTSPALMRASQLLEKVAGGTTDGGIIDVYPEPVMQRTVLLDPERTDALLGVKIQETKARNILQSLGFEVSAKGTMMSVLIPTRRSDVTGPEDIIEEIGRVYGYDSIPSAAPVLPVYDEHSWVQEDTGAVWDEYSFIRERGAICRVLAGAGYSEVFNYSFISEEHKDIFGLAHLRELASPQSLEYRYLRPSLIHRMALNVRDNFRYIDTVRLFETGHRFPAEKPESSRLAIMLGSKSEGSNLFYEMKGAVDLLLEKRGISDVQYDDVSPFAYETLMKWCEAGKGAEVKAGNGEALGVAGILQRAILDKLKIKGTVAFAEFDLKKLITFAQHDREFEPLPKYPGIVRDISILIPVDTKINDILQVVQGADTGGIVQDVDVFDIFEPTGKEKLKPEGDTPEYGKSVAFHVFLRSDERTLTDKEADAAESAIRAALQEKLNAQMR